MPNLIKKKPKIFVMDRPVGGSANAYNRDNPTSNDFNILDQYGPKYWNTQTELFYNNSAGRKFLGNERLFRERIHEPWEGEPDTTYTFRGNDMLSRKEFKSTDTDKKRKEYEAVRGLFQKQLYRLLQQQKQQE